MAIGIGGIVGCAICHFVLGFMYPAILAVWVGVLIVGINVGAVEAVRRPRPKPYPVTAPTLPPTPMEAIHRAYMRDEIDEVEMERRIDHALRSPDKPLLHASAEERWKTPIRPPPDRLTDTSRRYRDKSRARPIRRG